MKELDDQIETQKSKLAVSPFAASAIRRANDSISREMECSVFSKRQIRAAWHHLRANIEAERLEDQHTCPSFPFWVELPFEAEVPGGHVVKWQKEQWMLVAVLAQSVWVYGVDLFAIKQLKHSEIRECEALPDCEALPAAASSSAAQELQQAINTAAQRLEEQQLHGNDASAPLHDIASACREQYAAEAKSKLTQLFSLVDTDSDELIDKDELERFLDSEGATHWLSLHATLTHSLTDAFDTLVPTGHTKMGSAVDEIMAILDENNDGRLSLAEFVSKTIELTLPQINSDSDVVAALKELDDQIQSQWSCDVVSFKDQYEHEAKTKLTELFNLVDIDGDGFIQTNELAKFLDSEGVGLCCAVHLTCCCTSLIIQSLLLLRHPMLLLSGISATSLTAACVFVV